MSSVEEVDEEWGSWSITWKDDVPLSILDACDPYRNPFSILRIYDSRVSEQRAWEDSGIYAGITISSTIGSSGRELRGYGLAWLMGEPGPSLLEDRDDIGPFSTTSVSQSAATGGLYQWMVSYLAATKTGLSLGYYSASKTAKFPWAIKARSTRVFMDSFVKPLWDVNWRVTPALRIDVGTVDELHPPGIRNIVAARKGARDIPMVGLRTSDIGLETEFDQWIRRAVAYNKQTDTFHHANDPFVAWNPDGDIMTYGHVFTIDDAGATPAICDGEAKRRQQENGLARSATLSVDEYDVTDKVRLGGPINIWDLEAGMWDLGNRMSYRGEVIYPVRLTVRAISWPIQSGMSVWIDKRHIGGGRGMVDITDHVQMSTGADSKITVGKVPSRLGRTTRRRSR